MRSSSLEYEYRWIAAESSLDQREYCEYFLIFFSFSLFFLMTCLEREVRSSWFNAHVRPSFHWQVCDITGVSETFSLDEKRHTAREGIIVTLS